MSSADPIDEEIQVRIAALRKHSLVSQARSYLRDKLPKDLVFHSAEHSDDVLAETVSFAVRAGRTDREIELLAVAAAFHDTGYAVDRLNHEEASAEIAKQALQRDGRFSPEEIELVLDMIVDTKMIPADIGFFQNPGGRLAGYLLDADLSNLGRDDFFEKLDLLCQERDLERASFYKSTLGFLTRHKWHTDVADTLRTPKKIENIRKLKEIVTAS